VKSVEYCKERGIGMDADFSELSEENKKEIAGPTEIGSDDPSDKGGDDGGE
jgi:hypothetical protein